MVSFIFVVFLMLEPSNEQAMDMSSSQEIKRGQLSEGSSWHFP